MSARPKGFDAEVLACRPRLLGFARKLTRNAVLAEDLVQETILRALQKADQFQIGTSMMAWLSVILRNEFYTRARRGKREVPDVDGIMASMVKVPHGQEAAYDVKLLFGYMERLSFEQRASLELVAIDGMPYEEVAAILDIPAGTVKSQVNRARAFLARFFGGRP